MSSSSSTGLAPGALFKTSEAFPIAFASFLRRHPEAWRVRRVDHFRPSDLNLAEHRVTLQGRIDPGLLARFVSLERDLELHLDPGRLRNGEPLKILVPALVHAKRLLLDFSIRNVENHAVPMLSRFESARVSAVHLTAVVVGSQEVTDAEAQSLHAALVALAFQDPSALEKRIDEWIAERNGEKPRANRTPRWGAHDALEGPDLLDWVQRDAEAFVSGLGSPFRNVVNGYLERAGVDGPRLEPYIPPLAHYSTVPELFLHSIRAVLKTFLGLAPVLESGQAGHLTRANLIDDPELLARRVENGPIKGLEVLRRVLASNGAAAAHELFIDLASWTSYVPLEIELGVPFVLKFSEMMQVGGEHYELNRGQRLVAAVLCKHSYPIPAKDADAVHVEIDVPDPALRLAGTPRIVARIPRWRGRWGGLTTIEVPLSWVFGAIGRPSERLVHLYSTRMRGENAEYEPVLRYLRLEVRFRLVRTVALGHVLAVFASVLAAGYIVGTAGRHGWTRKPIDTNDFRIVATVGALAITVSLWLTSIGHPRPLAFKKLDPLRALLCTSLVTIVAALAFYGIRVGLKL